MKKFNFDIVTSGVRIQNDDDLFEVSDRLFEAGCEDATCASYNQALYLSFTREADTYPAAVMSAIEQIESIHGLECRSVDAGDVVGLADVAELTGLTKAALSRYANGSRGSKDFPNPILRVDSKRPLWCWADIANWLEQEDKITFEQVEQARFTAEINTALQLRHANNASSVMALVASLKVTSKM